MDCTKTGNLIRELRLKQNMTQLQLAQQMGISDKTVSKWERGLGCPDVSLLIELAAALKVSVEQILSGSPDLPGQEKWKGIASMRKASYYICPVCGNLNICTGLAQVSCCGSKLEACTAQKASPQQKLCVEEIDGEWYVTSTHPMSKEDYISFVIFVSGANLQVFEQYPEWPLSGTDSQKRSWNLAVVFQKRRTLLSADLREVGTKSSDLSFCFVW